MISKKLIYPYVILTILVSICVIIYLFAKTQIYKDLSLNIGSGFIGTILTVLFIDRVNENNSDRERQEYKKIALSVLALELHKHFEMIFNIGKSSRDTDRDTIGLSFRGIFNAEYYNDIQHLNILGEAPIHPARPWNVFIEDNISRMVEVSRRVSDVYSIHLGWELTSVLEYFGTSGIAYFIPYIRTITIDQQTGISIPAYNIFFNEALRNQFKDYVDNFIILLDEYNKTFPEKKIEHIQDQWRNDVSPKIGSSRNVIILM